MDLNKVQEEISINLIVVVVLSLAVLTVGGYMVFSPSDDSAKNPNIEGSTEEPTEKPMSIEFEESSGKLHISVSNMADSSTFYVYSSTGDSGPKADLTQNEPLKITPDGSEVVLYSASEYSTTDDFEDPEMAGEVMYYSQFTKIYVLDSEDNILKTWTTED